MSSRRVDLCGCFDEKRDTPPRTLPSGSGGRGNDNDNENDNYMVQGKDLLLKANGRNIAASTGCTITMQQDFIDVASPTDGRAKRVMPSTYGWSASAECLCVSGIDADTLMGYIEQGTELQVSFYDREKGLFRKGTAYVSNVQASGSMGSLAKVQVQLQGSGALVAYEGEADVTMLDKVAIDDTAIEMTATSWRTYQDQGGSSIVALPAGSCIVEALNECVVVAHSAGKDKRDIAALLRLEDDSFVKEHQVALIAPGERVVVSGNDLFAVVYDISQPQANVKIYTR